MAKILIVEDEEVVRDGLAVSLGRDGHQVVKTDRGETVLPLIEAENPDLILLDVMLPGISGFDVCRELRRSGVDIPVIMLTAKAEEIDRVVGLEIGADDYVSKPFSLRELLARIHVQLRHVQSRRERRGKRYRFGNVEIDFDHLEAQREGKVIALTPKEFDILHLLIRNRGKLVTREELLKSIWNYSQVHSTRTVDTHILNLRHKVEDDPSNPKHILSVYGEGYKFVG